MKPLICLLFLPIILLAQDYSSYYHRYNMLHAPPSSFQDGMLGFVNPATLGLGQAPEGRFYWTTDEEKTWSFKDYAILVGGQNFGFGMVQQRMGDKKNIDYSVSLGFGSQAFAFGVAYDWSNGDAFFNRQQRFKAAAIARPFKQVSVGINSFWGLESRTTEAIFELGLRPFGSPTFTLFADALITEAKMERGTWSAGAVWQPFAGIHLVGRYFDTEAFTVGFVLDLGHGSIGMQSHYTDQEYGYNSYMLRSGGFKNNIVQKAIKNIGYVPIKIDGTVEHQKYVLFDQGTVRFYDLLRDIKAASNDPRISTIAVNIAGMRIRPEHAWELREELQKAKENDKAVVICFEEVGMTGYHVASVADLVVMDPMGMVLMPGLVMGRTYLKGTLEKLGLGFDEWRFFTHKTAMETFSRDQLSEADKEQIGAYLDAWDQLLLEQITESRQFSDSTWRDIVNNQGLFSGKSALEAGLVDKLDRWSNVEEIIKEREDRKLLKFNRSALWDNAVSAEQWGERPRIALVYGLGVCDMETGIRARFLGRVFEKLQKDNTVKAVVFRVDSPGGSGMASDVVAEALKKCAEEKPVIVSQGQVAGSGGYWISMYGDKIVAGPNTITGSIGVIGGWIWDEEFSDKLGMTADFLQRGDHADMEFGITLPLLGITVPARNLTPEERSRIEEWIRTHYDDFITRVAKGRDMTKEKVDSLGQGRFYAGVDGVKNGLVDEIGGLMTALEWAKEQAGLDKEDEFELVEIPKSRGLLEFLYGMTIVEKLEQDPVVRYIKMITEQPYAPVHMMPPGSYPGVEK